MTDNLAEPWKWQLSSIGHLLCVRNWRQDHSMQILEPQKKPVNWPDTRKLEKPSKTKTNDLGNA